MYNFREKHILIFILYFFLNIQNIILILIPFLNQKYLTIYPSKLNFIKKILFLRVILTFFNTILYRDLFHIIHLFFKIIIPFLLFYIIL